jgi:hypothetical protein
LHAGTQITRCAALPFTWYVTFEIRKRGLLRKKERSPRETRAFETEADAKAFARAKLQQGLVVFAGTINPHLPKELIHPQRVADWLGEEPQQSGPRTPSTS